MNSYSVILKDGDKIGRYTGNSPSQPELSSTTAFPYPPMKPNSNGSPPDQPMPHASHTPDFGGR